MKIVIISQTIHPARYPRSYRATELAIEFAKRGYQVKLFGVIGHWDYTKFQYDNPNIMVSSIPVFFAKENSQGTHKLNIIDRILAKLFGRIIYFPLIEFLFRVPQILYLERNIDVLITIAMPHSLHWGAGISKIFFPNSFPKTWIADCGDPFMGNPIKTPPFYFQFLENLFLKNANWISVPIRNAIKAYNKKYDHKFVVIPQGFLIPKFDFNKEKRNKTKIFIYAGTFYTDHRNPKPFLDFLVSYTGDFQFVIYTKTPDFVTPYLNKLGEKLEIRDYIDRVDLIDIMRKSDFLINFSNRSDVQLPSKLIDYFISQKPILNVDFNDEYKVTFHEFMNGDYSKQMVFDDKDQYRIENVVNSFEKLFN